MEIDTIWAVMAAYNEEEQIEKTLRSVFQYIPKVVVVDDASSDNTGNTALRTGAHVLRHPVNLGQGAALQTGIEYALAMGAEYIVTFDADGQHDAAEILPMAKALQDSGAMIALGNRFMGKVVNISPRRKILLKLAIYFTKLTSGGNFQDVHNGFRIMRRAFAMQFAFTQNRMAHASEILNYIVSHKIPYVEYPVTIAYTEYSIRKGQKNSDALRVLMELFTGYFFK
ncbi:glycosyltransferase family 2 protein [Desulfovibrio sp. OttesenSCG-928-G15]|nr:glycosyltransferase family 2 protein [Desulfovibrio sp. OttesenSCG-928-G15]